MMNSKSIIASLLVVAASGKRMNGMNLLKSEIINTGGPINESSNGSQILSGDSNHEENLLGTQINYTGGEIEHSPNPSQESTSASWNGGNQDSSNGAIQYLNDGDIIYQPSQVLNTGLIRSNMSEGHESCQQLLEQIDDLKWKLAEERAKREEEERKKADLKELVLRLHADTEQLTGELNSLRRDHNLNEEQKEQLEVLFKKTETNFEKLQEDLEKIVKELKHEKTRKETYKRGYIQSQKQKKLYGKAAFHYFQISKEYDAVAQMGYMGTDPTKTMGNNVRKLAKQKSMAKQRLSSKVRRHS